MLRNLAEISVKTEQHGEPMNILSGPRESKAVKEREVIFLDRRKPLTYKPDAPVYSLIIYSGTVAGHRRNKQ